jgi:hypothetical protein
VWRSLALAETVSVFAVFLLQGAWPVPDVNEPYYLGKTIHFWNPDWIPCDFFLDSADSHKVFYFTFGWLSLWLGPVLLAWTGRLLTWGLLAWSWRRLSWAVVPRPWYAVLTAALLVALMERCHMAGEWLIGGVEAKGFAFVLLLLGLEAVVRGRWNRAWLLIGAAAAFHVLVGGWAAVAIGLAWLVCGRQRPPLGRMAPAMLGGLALSLPGLIPSLELTWGVDPAVVREANQIYVFDRLSHHLLFDHFPWWFKARFIGLCAAALFLFWIGPRTRPLLRLRSFCIGAMLIAAMGAVICWTLGDDPALEAALLRFYWFRLADLAVPLAVAVTVAACIARDLDRRPRRGVAMLTLAALLAFWHVGGYALLRASPTVPRAFRLRSTAWRSESERWADYAAWQEACAWVAEPGHVPPDARFFTPHMSQTFEWDAGRSEVAVLKNIPQDAESIVEWWQRIREVYAGGTDRLGRRWCKSLAEREPGRLLRLGRKYGAGYLLVERNPPLPFPIVYSNQRLVIYRLEDVPPP